MNAARVEMVAARLTEPEAGVRRTAILDLIAVRGREGRAIEALLAHLPRETDQRAALLIIRHLGRERHAAAMPVLWSLYENPGTPVAVAHAAIVEHDRILGAVAGDTPLR